MGDFTEEVNELEDKISAKLVASYHLSDKSWMIIKTTGCPSFCFGNREMS